MHRFERCQSTESIWEEPEPGTFFRTTLRSTQQPMRQISWAASLCLPLPVDNKFIYSSTQHFKTWKTQTHTHTKFRGGKKNITGGSTARKIEHGVCEIVSEVRRNCSMSQIGDNTNQYKVLFGVQNCSRRYRLLVMSQIYYS